MFFKLWYVIWSTTLVITQDASGSDQPAPPQEEAVSTGGKCPKHAEYSIPCSFV